MNKFFSSTTESRQCAYTFSSVCANHSPPAHLLQGFGTLPAIGERQLTGRAGVIREQREEGSKSLAAAVQTEVQVVQLDSDTSRAFVALVTQGEENIRLATVSAPTQQHSHFVHMGCGFSLSFYIYTNDVLGKL